MSEVKTPVLVDAQYMKQQNPETFYAPSIDDLKEISVGDNVKVCAGRERFWVEITEVYENGKIKGKVNNDLIFTNEHELSCDDQIILLRKNVYDILKK